MKIFKRNGEVLPTGVPFELEQMGPVTYDNYVLEEVTVDEEVTEIDAIDVGGEIYKFARQVIRPRTSMEKVNRPYVVQEMVKVSYPWNWLDHATPEDLAERGITVEEVPDPVVVRKVRKSVIISRLTDAQLSQAIGMLSVRQQERWRAPDQPSVNSDDPETLAVLKAVGADPAVVMAPE